MTTSETAPSEATFGKLGISWKWLLVLGIVMAVLGVIGLGMSYFLTLAAIFYFGILALIGGVVQFFDAFKYQGWKGIGWHILIAVVYVAAGLVLIFMPVQSAFWLTLFLAVSLVVVGIARIVMAFQMRGTGQAWGWVVVSGLISIALGVLVYSTVIPPSPEALATPEGQIAWVRDWGWVIGLFVAVELLMEGVAMISIALAARRFGSGVGGPGTGRPAAA